MPRWEEVRPILVAAYELMDESADGATQTAAIAERVGRDSRDATWGRDLRVLVDAAYLKIPDGFGAIAPDDPVDGTEKGRQEVQGWPGPRTPAGSAELLVDLLDKLSVSEQTPEPERGRVKKAADAIRDAGTDTIAKAIGEVVARSTGIN